MPNRDDPSYKAYRRVPVYTANPWLKSREGYVYKGDGSNNTLKIPQGHQKLMHTWCNGMTVPLFDLKHTGLGQDSDEVNVHRQYYDGVRKKDTRVYTEGEVIYQTRPDKHFKYAGGNPFYSMDKPNTFNWDDFGLRPRSRAEEQGVRWSASKYEYWRDSSINYFSGYGNGAFEVTHPSNDKQGKDRIISYHWGDYDKSPNAGLKNVCGMYWFQSNHSDSGYYSWINTIVYIYQDGEGNRVFLHPYYNSSRTSGLSKNDNMRYPENATYAMPGTAVNYDQDNARQKWAGVLRGAMLRPDQVRYVVDNQLVLTGMAIEISKRTPATGTGNPQACFYNFFPWILGDTTRFGQYYLHPMDYQAFKGSANDQIYGSYLKDAWYKTDEDRKSRQEYFNAYEEQINKQGGFKNGELIDTSGQFNKQLIIPPVTNWDSNPLSYTDNMAQISSCGVHEQPAGAYGSEYFLHSNTSYISPKMPTNDGLA